MEDQSRLQHLMQQFLRLSMVEGYCDITFYDKPPIIGARISPKLNAAMMYGAGAAKMNDLFTHIETRNGVVFSIHDVWVVVEFPGGLPSEKDLADVDLADGEARLPQGITLREMAREIYKCETDVEAEIALRRVLAA